MQITNPRLSVSQFGDSFNLLVEYTATFVPQEAQHEFEDAIMWAERDSGDPEDLSFFHSSLKVGGRFNPLGKTSVFRRHEKNGVSADDLDSGSGDEDLVGVVHLRNFTLQGQNIRVRTNIVTIDA
jgi:hypothetical protein